MFDIFNITLLGVSIQNNEPQHELKRVDVQMKCLNQLNECNWHQYGVFLRGRLVNQS